MTFLPLNLGVGAFADAGKKGVSVLIKSEMQKVLRKDGYTCRFCGFASQKFQRVIPFVGEGGTDDFVTACAFCEQVANLDKGALTGAGVLIWLPEINQVDLNHIVRAIYIARASEDALANTANQALDALMARRADLKKRLGTNDPSLLATALCENMSEKDYKKYRSKLDGVRFLPADKHLVRSGRGDVNQFPQMLEYWCSSEGPFAEKPVERWLEMFQKADAAVGHA